MFIIESVQTIPSSLGKLYRKEPIRKVIRFHFVVQFAKNEVHQYEIFLLCLHAPPFDVFESKIL